MTRDGLTRMDVDTRWAYHRKSRRLQRLYPDTWPTFHAAYMALLGEVWFTKSRDITLEDAWLPALPCSLEEATAALRAAGYLGADGRIPPGSWDEWVGPALVRIEAKTARGKRAADARWHGDDDAEPMPEASVSNAQALPEQSNGYTPRQPASQPTTPPIVLSTPKAVTAREPVPESQRRLKKEEFDRMEAEWASFGGAMWRPFREAWIKRGLVRPPSGSADDDAGTSQRSRLYRIADARPTDLGRWVQDAPGTTAHAVIEYVFEKWAGIEEEVEDTEEAVVEVQKSRRMEPVGNVIRSLS